MLTTAQLEKYADILIWGLFTARKKKFNNYDTILIRYYLDALPLTEIIYRKLLQKKMNVVARQLANPLMEKDFYDFSDKTQRSFLPAGEKEFYQALNGNIYLHAPASLTHLKDIDAKKISESILARKPIREILDKSEENGAFGWTLCTLPTPELAKQAGLSLKEYTEQIVKACFLNEKDPVKKWQQIYKDSLKIKKWLNALPVKKYLVSSKSVDLEITPGEKRRFVGISGHNIPSFELYTSPDWRGTRGTYYADQPSFRSGNYVKGVKLVFEKGRAVKISAEQGDAFVKKTLSMDKGAAQIGEFSLTDIRFSKIDKFMADTLFDENYGGKFGNCHLAVGSSYSDTFAGDPKKLTKKIKQELGFNDSALHWDLVNTEDKVVEAVLKNGKKIIVYEKGKFAC